MAAKFYRLDATKVTIGFNITQPSAQGTLHLTTDASFDDTTRKLDLPNIRIVSDIRYAGDQRRTHAELQSSATYTSTTKALQVSPLKLTATTQGTGLPEPGIPLTVNTSIAGDFEKQTLSVQDLAVQAANVIASGNLHIDQLKTAPSFRGTLATEPFDVRALLTQIGQPVPVTQDKQVLKKAAVAIEFQGTTTQGRVDKFTGHLDDTTLNATAFIEDFSKPRAQFDLALDGLNIDRYLPPPVKGEPTATPSTPGSAAAAGASELPLETLRSLDLNGSIKAGRLTASKLTVTGLNATLTAKAGVIQLHPLRAKLYDGTYEGKITLDARGKALKIAADESLSEVQMGPITTAFLGKPSIEGRGSLKLKVKTEGTDSSSWLRALSGITHFSLRDGKVIGVDITQVLADGVKLYKKDDPAKPKEEKNELTRFATLAASATIKDGMLTSRDLNLAAKELAFSGAGNVNLVDQSIDYTVTAMATEYAAEKLGKYLKDVKNIPIDGIISGPLREPKFDLDVGGSLERRAKQEVKQKVDEKKEEAVQKIEKKVEEKLKKFLGQ
jgi:AsmA protein